MIRQSAFEGNKQLLKGCLHSHTTRSDGRMTPEELMKYYAEHGYNFMAITDHRVYNRTNYAPETGICIIPGFEVDAYFDYESGMRNYHTVCIGPDDETNGFADGELVDSISFPRQGNTPELIAERQAIYQEFLDEIHAKNNMTFYCHPEWSGTPARFFDKLSGDFGVEVYNTGCDIENDMDTNAPYWDELLGMGKKLWGIAVDDGHYAECCCGGWVMVNAENNVPSLLEALKNGAFYSSCGPVIKDFYVENGRAYLDADDCATINFVSERHPSNLFRAPAGGTISHAESGVEGFKYIRGVVTDRNGKRAWTNPIYLD